MANEEKSLFKNTFFEPNIKSVSECQITLPSQEKIPFIIKFIRKQKRMKKEKVIIFLPRKN